MQKLKPYLFPIFLIIGGLIIANAKETTYDGVKDDYVTAVNPTWKGFGSAMILLGIAMAAWQVFKKQ